MVNEKPKQKQVKKKENLKSKRNKNNKTLKKNNNQKVIKKQADDKSARIKKAQTIKKLFTWIILIGIFIALAIFLCTSKMFDICKIESQGNIQLSYEKILKLSEINLESNIFLTNTLKAENKIKKEPYIEEVKVKRVFPDKIKIEIKEKEKEYMLQIAENYAYIDKYGQVLEISSEKVENLVELQSYITSEENILAGKFLSEEDLERIQDVQKILNSAEKNQFRDKITSIDIKDKNNYKLSLITSRKIVYIGDTSNLETKMLRTKDILDKTIEQEGKIFVNVNFNKGFDPYFREETNLY